MKTATPKMVTDMPQRGYSYARISTGSDQAEGDGVRRQQGTAEDDREPWTVKVCREQGWVLDDTLIYTDKGKSGYHKKNLSPTADLTRFLKDIDRRRIQPGSVLLIEQIDRLSRAAVNEAYDLFRGIINRGVWICTKVPFRIYRPDAESSFIDIMEPLWIMYVAWMESLKKSERATAAWETARKLAAEAGRPLPGRCPFWIRQTEDGRHELLPLAAAAVIRAHELCQVDDKGACLIREQLEAEGFPPPGEYRRQGGYKVRVVKPWTEATVQWLLGTRTVLGEYQPQRKVEGKRVDCGDPIPLYPPVPGFDEDYWRSTQAAIAARKGVRGRPGGNICNVFLGLAHDAVSRKRLVLRSKGRGPGKRREKYPYLTSHNVGGLRVPYEPFELWVLRTVAMLRVEDVVDASPAITAREQEICALSARVESLQAEERRLKEEHRKRAAADPDRDLAPVLDLILAVADDRRAAAARRDALKLESKTGRAESLGECQELFRRISTATGAERKELQERARAALPGVVSSIWVQAQPVAVRVQIVHIQIWLHSGLCRYKQLSPPKLHGVRVWDLDPEVGGPDLRRGPYRPEHGTRDITGVTEPT